MLDSLLVILMLFSSFSLRTPNVQPNPDDYEVSIGVNHENLLFQSSMGKRIGEKYIDDLFWVKIDNSVYFKPEYMNKESKSVKYLKLDSRKVIKGISVVLTTRSTDDDLNDYTKHLLQ